MSIAINAAFYHRVSQLPHIDRIVSGMEPGSTLDIITSKRSSVKLKKALTERGGRLLSKDIMCNHCDGDEYIRYHDVNIGIMAPSVDLRTVAAVVIALLVAVAITAVVSRRSP